jgi:hypothetical protein
MTTFELGEKAVNTGSFPCAHSDIAEVDGGSGGELDRKMLLLLQMLQVRWLCPPLPLNIPMLNFPPGKSIGKGVGGN